MNKIIILILVLLLYRSNFSQSPSWHTLPNAPVADSGVERFDDIYFINPTTGWIIEGNPYFAPQDTGKVFKTTDGGHNWAMINKKIPYYLRDIGFFDANTGVLGTLDSTHYLYRTTDGGFNWTQITNVTGQAPLGICGISIVNSNVIYASGRYWGQANVLKSTDAGLSWVSLNLNGLANTLIDCYFWSSDSGVVVGGLHPNPYLLNGNAVILYTSNSGQSWTRVYQSNRTNEWCWKVQFVKRLLGYASIERGGAGISYYLKTTNGGLNWVEYPFMVYDQEGIGFLNTTTGWIGGWGNNPGPGPTYETTNAGTNWHLAGWGINMNRIRFLSDTLAYASGKRVYKYTREAIGVIKITNDVPKEFSLSQNYPNPFNPTTKINYQIPITNYVRLIVYDVLGKEIKVLVNEIQSAGSYQVEFDGSKYASGVHFYKLETEAFTETKKMILAK